MSPIIGNVAALTAQSSGSAHDPGRQGSECPAMKRGGGSIEGMFEGDGQWLACD
jgi:hypothetical protein